MLTGGSSYLVFKLPSLFNGLLHVSFSHLRQPLPSLLNSRARSHRSGALRAVGVINLTRAAQRSQGRLGQAVMTTQTESENPAHSCAFHVNFQLV